ncbi:cytosolic sulfotransferase 5 [Setaria viridis]|nr:cytosolic sulfotransferase 5-like [Setaria viridis]
MATATAPTALSVAAGPVPFTDVCGARPDAVPLLPDGDASATASAPPSSAMRFLRWHQGTWLASQCVPGVVAIQQGSFVPRRGDVVLASAPKCGTTWLKALAFATMARGAHPPAGAGHPLLRLNPHDCVPFMDILFADAGSGSAKMAALPSPRLMNTHMHHSILPDSISNNPGCKIVYICRDPKDMLVSLWHFTRTVQPNLTFTDVFERACEGVSFNGPIWDHVLGYWNASKESPETVLFLRYEEILRDPVGNVRKLALFVGQPFSPAEEDAGVAMDVVRLCSFDKMKGLEVNKKAVSHGLFPNSSYFRRGEAGDWANHMTPEMARRLDAIMEEKLRGSGLSFA